MTKGLLALSLLAFLAAPTLACDKHKEGEGKKSCSKCEHKMDKKDKKDKKSDSVKKEAKSESKKKEAESCHEPKAGEEGACKM